MKRSIFWDITPRSPLKVNRRFGRACRIMAYSSTLKMEATSSPKFRSTFNGLHCIISQRTEIFTVRKSGINVKTVPPKRL
jgi:hypothetical protein